MSSFALFSYKEESVQVSQFAVGTVQCCALPLQPPGGRQPAGINIVKLFWNIERKTVY